MDRGLGCADHLLNLIVKDALKANADVYEAYKVCKDLSQKSHMSALTQQRIARECEIISLDSSNEEDPVYRKIIRSVETRWNSALMMIKSIIKLRVPLESIRDGLNDAILLSEGIKRDEKLVSTIPSEDQFDILTGMVPVLDQIQIASELLSAEKKVTICHVIPSIVNMHDCISKSVNFPHQPKPVVAFLKALKTGLDKRFPESGTKNFLHCMGVLLHPSYKGLALKDFGSAFDDTVKEFFEQNDNELAGQSTEDPDRSFVPAEVEWSTFELMSQRHAQEHEEPESSQSLLLSETRRTGLFKEFNAFR